MNSSIADFTGHTLYLDTMIPYALLRGIEPEAKQLFERIQTGSIEAYTSALTFDELAYRLLLALIRDHYEGSPLDRLRHEEENMIRQFYPMIAPQLKMLRYFPHLTIIEITKSDIDAMNETILQYFVKPRDALHIAAARKSRCYDMVSNDADFDRIPFIRRYTLK
jgi:predicted nucleic acid-binding protein